MGYSLHLRKDKKLESCADEVIDLIGRAQSDDGYIHTYFIIERPDLRFKNLWECHELYCAGHFFEAAVAYYNATGKSPYFFDVEWEARGKTSYWNGWNPCDAPSKINTSVTGGGAEYNQSHKPVRKQDEAVGHSVRVVYMLCGMADIAIEVNDKKLLEACNTLWDNIVNKKMYITGAIGSTHVGEAFMGNYDLPNDSLYGETCASIGLAMASKRMLNNSVDSKYSDIVEKEMYNGIISGIAMDGKGFFYVNPLEVYPEQHTDPSLSFVKVERQKWYPCACCPPNVARFLLNLGDYIYSSDKETVYFHQYIANEAKIDLSENTLNIKINCDLIKSHNIKIEVKSREEKKYNIAFRIPSWSDKFEILINEEEVKDYHITNRYLYLNRIWSKSENIEIKFLAEVKLMRANNQIRYNAGKVALSYGPLVYCAEEIDNGKMLYNLSVNKKKFVSMDTFKYKGLDIPRIKISGFRDINHNEQLYFETYDNIENQVITLIPYHFWGNRGIGEMQVWLRAQ